ncbi:MAG: DUF3489 domain-containing protein [Sphingomonas sp.]|nr:DUF3489 domain-containing protein [Sphingomonas sp.]
MTSTNINKQEYPIAREPKIEVASVQENTGVHASPPQEHSGPTTPKEPNKTEKVLALLQRSEGGMLDELVEATGWLPHTMRAALTGLKKKGHRIERTRVDGVSRYTLVGTAVE